MRRTLADLSPIAGALKVVPEDFVVEELPDGPPDGAGAHRLLLVEKRGRDTREVVDALGRLLRIPTPEIGVAGQKDRQAVTRQWISVPMSAERGGTDLAGLAGDGWRVLEVHAHGEKLRVGRLSGNRFRIRLRGGAAGAQVASEGLARLCQTGLPNYFGPQRFGRAGDNAARGREILRGERREKKRFRARLYLSALQSELFNTWLDARIDDGLLHRAIPGDLLRTRLDGTLLEVTDPGAASAEVAASRADPTGPIFGSRMRPASAEAGGREAAVLEAAGVEADDLLRAERDAPGTRRPARAWLSGPSAAADGEDLLLVFDLERGAYATVVLAELGLKV
jgi:tRNA pseudouridine13 synthase